MQHFYETIPHWFDFQDVYREAIERCPDGGHLVELGVYEGASLAFLAVEAINSGKRLRITGVDRFNWPVGVHARVQGWIDAHNLGHVVTLLARDTFTAAGSFHEESLDFIFVDASHEEEDVFRDLNSYFPKLKPTGRMAGHDWYPEFPGVQRACERFFPAVGCMVEPCSVRSWRMVR